MLKPKVICARVDDFVFSKAGFLDRGVAHKLASAHLTCESGSRLRVAALVSSWCGTSLERGHDATATKPPVLLVASSCNGFVAKALSSCLAMGSLLPCPPASSSPPPELPGQGP